MLKPMQVKGHNYCNLKNHKNLDIILRNYRAQGLHLYANGILNDNAQHEDGKDADDCRNTMHHTTNTVDRHWFKKYTSNLTNFQGAAFLLQSITESQDWRKSDGTLKEMAGN